MMTKSIAEGLARPIAIGDRLFAASRVDPFARLREFPFAALQQLPRIGDALAGYRRAVTADCHAGVTTKHGEP